jgi:uncharacterized protein YoxC
MKFTLDHIAIMLLGISFEVFVVRLITLLQGIKERLPASANSAKGGTD